MRVLDSTVRHLLASSLPAMPAYEDEPLRYMLAACERERRQSEPQPAAAPTVGAAARAMEGAGRRRARPFNNEPFLSVDTGVDPELNEPPIGLGAGKAFPWSLSIGCNPTPTPSSTQFSCHQESQSWREPPKVTSR